MPLYSSEELAKIIRDAKKKAGKNPRMTSAGVNYLVRQGKVQAVDGRKMKGNFFSEEEVKRIHERYRKQ